MGTKRGYMAITVPTGTHYKVLEMDGRFRAFKYTANGKQVGAVVNPSTRGIWFDTAEEAEGAAIDNNLQLLEVSPMSSAQSSVPPRSNGEK